MKRTLEIFTSIMTMMLFMLCTSISFMAYSTSDAVERLDTLCPCRLHFTYAIEGETIQNLEIAIYKVAALQSDYQFELTDAFKKYPLEINGIQSQSEWNEITDTIESYIVADKIVPTAFITTDINGSSVFHCMAGVYYIECYDSYDSINKNVKSQNFAPFIVVAPELNEKGYWNYDMDIYPKPGVKPLPETSKITIVKLWNDGTESPNRPKEISVDVYRNGYLFDSIKLTAKDNWTYTYESEEKYVWTAVERDVPKDYTVSIKNKADNVIHITNTIKSDPGPIPHTGDTSSTYPILMLISMAGLILILIGGRRKHFHEK